MSKAGQRATTAETGNRSRWARVNTGASAGAEAEARDAGLFERTNTAAQWPPLPVAPLWTQSHLSAE